MRRGLMHAAAWTLATGAAVTLSWYGVHTVMSGTAYDPPRALPLSAAAPSPPDASPQVSSTHRPKPSPSAGPGSSPSGAPPASAAPSRTGSAAPRHRPGTPAGSLSGGQHVKSWSTAGGRVVFDLRDDSAQLVSATPNPGWEMQVWKQESWIRVDFTGPGHASVFCTWNGHPPMVQSSQSTG
ncbi:hypothetical protein [Streptomyces pinistramenti]|uniref:hypothetical protein n=1 Tax=Streptomyces pinistramenti TaxID=2884812 RepID=UPI001D073951|nr:hypothetical protein [Streptomyces pinistramenti]MCB5910327.1 hypothetical protein [Streptomyces pinistramenti]